MVEIYAIFACIILLSLALFQVALIAGAPLGKFAWGGKHMILPISLRISSAVSMILYGIFAGVILSSAGVITAIYNPRFVEIGMWVLTYYFAFGIILNGISRSKFEKVVMTPVALILAVTCFLIAID